MNQRLHPQDLRAKMALEFYKITARAMEDERRLVDAQHAKRQASLLAAIQKLSPADRKAFAEDARNARARVEARTSQWRKGGGERGPGGPGQPGTQRPLL